MTLTRLVRTAGLAAAVLALGACATVKNHRGYVSDAQLVSALQVGIDNRESVRGTLGEPTFVSRFAPKDWYYVSDDTTQVAFNDPKIRKVEVIKVSFDASDNLSAIVKSGEELAVRVDPMKGETPTLGYKGGLLEEIFGNVGTVGSGALPGAAGAAGQTGPGGQ